MMQRFGDKDTIVIGVDEVGRGAIAGDVIACACVVNYETVPSDVTDSKLLTSKKRENIDLLLREDSKTILSIGVGSIDEIEKHNILQATMMAMSRAISDILLNIENKNKKIKIIIDGITLPRLHFSNINVQMIPVVNGDNKFIEIASASILAKVYRDKMMSLADVEHPQYFWKYNFGYGTKNHISALKKSGPSVLHRMSFLKKILSDYS